ncbi:LexA family protein [Sphingomonas crocodyli]|uniref:MarR family transcriptional regulator n=1 Tax=Sphingomonas crocodyli TaxID=1979270 RepID=A0A437M7L4_9SPHN|nr:MarR family transcriptional regulator [Sphingomonas crocodyli]RVT93721.1 MarR family transcriptional regulator [Sphingomonas crocodyli]
MIGLTPRQAELLAILRADPTVTMVEMAKRMGITRRWSVAGHLTALEERGYIERRPGQSPSFRLNAHHGSTPLRFISVQSLPIAGALPA